MVIIAHLASYFPGLFIWALQAAQPAQPTGESQLWSQALLYGPTTVMLALILLFLIRLAPVWKEVQLKKIEAGREETVVKHEQAAALGQLAGALKEIAVEQRRATEEVGILQRVNAETADQVSVSVKQLSRRLDDMESRITRTSPHHESEAAS